MELFGTRRKQVEALEREVLSNPTPQNLVALIERFIALGDETRAVDIARRAIERFPESEQCIGAYQIVRRIQLQTEIQDLNRALRKDPTVSHYERLANLHLSELGDRTKAFEIALEGLTRFPSSDGLHLICGQIRMERFHKDYLGNDFTEAVRHFEEARRANASNLKALIHLSRLYSEVGAFDPARGVIRRALEIDPGTMHLSELTHLMEVHGTEAVSSIEDAVQLVEKQRGFGKVGIEVRRLFEPIARESGAVQIDPAKIEQFLAGYQAINGYKCSVVITSEGALVAAQTRGGIPSDLFLGVVQPIHASTLESTHRMDAGGLVSGEIETAIGRIVLASSKNLVLALLADYPAKKQDLDSAVDRFVAFTAVR